MVAFEARVAEGLGALLLRPRDCSDEVEALRALRASLPAEVRVRRSAEGLRVGPEHVGYLLAASPPVEIGWTEGAHRFATNRVSARRAYPALRNDLRTLGAEGAADARRRVSDSGGFEVLDDHQVVNVAAMTLRGGFGLCLFDEQGAGKTVSLIFAYDLLAARGEADRLLVIAPKSMVPEWSRRLRPLPLRICTASPSSQAPHRKRWRPCRSRRTYM